MLGLGMMDGKVMQFTHFSVKEFLCLATSSQVSRVVSHHAEGRSNWSLSMPLIISPARDYYKFEIPPKQYGQYQSQSQVGPAAEFLNE